MSICISGHFRVGAAPTVHRSSARQQGTLATEELDKKHKVLTPTVRPPRSGGSTDRGLGVPAPPTMLGRCLFTFRFPRRSSTVAVSQSLKRGAARGRTCLTMNLGPQISPSTRDKRTAGMWKFLYRFATRPFLSVSASAFRPTLP